MVLVLVTLGCTAREPKAGGLLPLPEAIPEMVRVSLVTQDRSASGQTLTGVVLVVTPLDQGAPPTSHDLGAYPGACARVTPQAFADATIPRPILTLRCRGAAGHDDLNVIRRADEVVVVHARFIAAQAQPSRVDEVKRVELPAGAELETEQETSE